jgi:hypothetical protein
VTTCRARGCRAPANRHSCSRVVASVPAAEMQQAGPTALLTLFLLGWDGTERACMCQIHLSERGPGPSASNASRPCLALIMISPPLRSNETAINHPPSPPLSARLGSIRVLHRLGPSRPHTPRFGHRRIYLNGTNRDVEQGRCQLRQESRPASKGNKSPKGQEKANRGKISPSAIDLRDRDWNDR